MASSGMQGSYFQGYSDARPLAALGAALAFHGMPPSAPHLRRDLVLWMVALRRITVLAGLSVAVLEKLLLPDELALAPVLVVALAVCIYNEIGGRLLRVDHPGRTAAVVNAQVALDTVSLVAILHFGGGLTSLGVLFFAPAFFAYGAVLPLPLAFVHVALATLELALLGVGELGGMVGHFGSGGFYRPEAYGEWGFVALVVMAVTTVDALCAYLSHYLSGLLGVQEERSRALAAARADLLARNEREAARVRVLLEVAQHVSAMHTVEALLRAVCETTVALVRVPRVEIFLWDAERQGLCLAAAHGLAVEPDGAGEVRYTADLPIVGRLRGGEVVQFGAAPSHALVSGRVTLPFSRGFAAPMVCRGSFEGALFVGYDEEDAGELVELVQGIARQAALALVNVRTMEQQQEDAEVSRVLLSLAQGLSSCLDEDALWQLLVRGASEVLDLPWSVAARFDERSGTFRITGGHGVPEADLEATARLKSEFVSTMSHELRTPLNVIIGYTEMLREGAVGPITLGQRELIDRLDARGRELLELIEATLHVGRLEAGRDMVEISAVPLRDLLQALHASTCGLPRVPEVAFEWETPEDVAQRIMTDRAKVALVVRNLVSNAFKFTSQGEVRVRLVVQAEALVIEVRDTGIGIGAEYLPIIFDMFRQVDGTTTRRHGGVGLGLYIVKQFVSRLGGTIEGTSPLGHGSRFRVVLPGVIGDEHRSAA